MVGLGDFVPQAFRKSLGLDDEVYIGGLVRWRWGHWRQSLNPFADITRSVLEVAIVSC